MATTESGPATPAGSHAAGPGPGPEPGESGLDSAEPGRAPAMWWVLWLSVAAALCAPIWLPGVPPLSDYYDHLVRLQIVRDHDSIAAYQQLYDVDWFPYPNLGLQLLGLPLLAVAPLLVVGKIILTITVLLWHVAVTLLSRAVCGRMTRRALVASFFIYNQQFLHGYCNFSLAMGLALCALALWITSRDRWTLVRLLAVTLLAIAAYLAHIMGFATFAVAATTMTLTRMVRKRRLDGHGVLGLAVLIPCTVLFAVGLAFPRGDFGMSPTFATVGENARRSLTLVTGYDPLIDLLSLAALALTAVVVVGAALALRARMAVRSDLLMAGLVLGALYWLMPSDIGAGHEVNVRFALGSATLLFFALDIRLGAGLTAAVFLALLSVFAVRTGTTAAYWIELDREFTAQRQAFETIEPGAAVHNIHFHAAPRWLQADRVHTLAHIHALSFAAIDREARVPSMYGARGWQLLSHRDAMYRSHRFRDGTRPDIPWDRVFAEYRYVWTCRAPGDVVAPLLERGAIVAHTRSCRLFDLQPAPRPSDGDTSAE